MKLHIDRLELDLRGIDPALAQAAVQALGPALQRELARRGAAPAAAAERLDAGTLRLDSMPGAAALAHQMAQRLAHQLMPPAVPAAAPQPGTAPITTSPPSFAGDAT